MPAVKGRLLAKEMFALKIFDMSKIFNYLVLNILNTWRTK